jgi:phosphatidylserine synthase
MKELLLIKAVVHECVRFRNETFNYDLLLWNIMLCMNLCAYDMKWKDQKRFFMLFPLPAATHIHIKFFFLHFPIHKNPTTSTTLAYVIKWMRRAKMKNLKIKRKFTKDIMCDVNYGNMTMIWNAVVEKSWAWWEAEPQMEVMIFCCCQLRIVTCFIINAISLLWVTKTNLT